MECTPASQYSPQLSIAQTAAKIAGEIIIKGSQNRKEVTVKSGVDLVTSIDKAAEVAIVEHIKQAFPNDIIIGEEDSSLTGENEAKQNQLLPTTKPVWCIDPLNGTTNFVHGYPFVNVSIGYCVNGTPVVGVIYNPFLNEMFEAEEGRGAYLNGKPISVDSSSGLSDALIVNNIGHIRDLKFIEESTQRVSRWLSQGLRAIRMSGSAAQNMADVACGRVSSYYEHGYGGPWDVCAGTVIVREAGGVVCSAVDKSKFQMCFGKGSVCCGNENVVKDVLNVAQEPKIKF